MKMLWTLEMDIHFLDTDPNQCAIWHTDRTLVRMITLYEDIIYGVHINCRDVLGYILPITSYPRDSFIDKNNQFLKWAMRSRSNLCWMLDLLDGCYRVADIRSRGLADYRPTNAGPLVLPDNIASDEIVRFFYASVKPELCGIPYDRFEHDTRTMPPCIVADRNRVKGNPVASYRNLYNMYHRNGVKVRDPWASFPSHRPPWFNPGIIYDHNVVGKEVH